MIGKCNYQHFHACQSSVFFNRSGGERDFYRHRETNAAAGLYDDSSSATFSRRAFGRADRLAIEHQHQGQFQ